MSIEKRYTISREERTFDIDNEKKERNDGLVIDIVVNNNTKTRKITIKIKMKQRNFCFVKQNLDKQ